jgi:uncharacterized protein
MSFRLVRLVMACAGIVFVLLLANTLPKLTFNNDYWLPKNNTFQQDLDYLEAEFQPGFGAIVVLTFPNSFFTEENIDWFRQFRDKIEALPNVFKVNSPLDATVIINSDDMLTIQTYDEALDEENISSIAQFESLFKQSPYYGKLLSKDHRYVGISVSIDKENDGNDLMRRVAGIEDIQALLKTLPNHIKGFVSGDAAIYYKMDGATQHNLVTLLPIAFMLLVLVAWLFLRQWRSVCIILVPTLINLGVVPIVLVLLGHYITIINITLFILVLVIAVADGVHMLNYWERFTLQKSKTPIADTIRATWLPCFITSITTAVGFGSFVTSSIIPLHQYGIQAFITMLFAFIIVMSVVPMLLQLIPPKVHSKEDIELFPNLVERLLVVTKRHYKTITLVLVALTIGLAQALWFASTETSFISVFFNANHPVRQDVNKVDAHLTGSGRLDVILKSTDDEAFKQLATFENMEATVQRALAHPKIEGYNNMGVPVQMIHKAFKSSNTQYPKSNEELEQEILFLEFSRGENKTDVLSSVVDFNYQSTRIEFIIDQLSSSKVEKIIDHLSKTFANWPVGKVVITGGQYLSYVLGNYVLESQLVTILITFSFVWILFCALFGIRLGSIGMIPNIMPMIITLSLLPITNTPFDFATVLISSVTLGLCVDDTIHWLHYYQYAKKSGQSDPAILTSRVMFKPLFLTSVILGIGFGVLGLADLVILKKFGLFTTLAIFLALAADIVALPAILRFFKFGKYKH